MERKTASMYVHAWDVVDEGPKTVVERTSSAGIDALNLAVSYHSGRFIQQHNPQKKVYFAEEGVVYFEPEPKYFRDSLLKPRRSSEYPNVDVLDLLLRETAARGMKVNAWTVTFHNSAFARAHPELAVVDAFDGKNYNYICPNNPASRTYHSALVRNLLDYDLNAIMLESSCYPPALQHGDHHENLGTQVEPLASELMTSCFCRHCIGKARESGLDLLKSKKLVREIVDTSFSMPTSVLRTTSVSETVRTSYVLSTDMEELRKLQSFQRHAVTELYAETRALIKSSRSKTKLHVIAFGGFSGESAFGRGSESLNLHELARVVDGIDLITYVAEPDVAYYLARWVKFEAGDCKLYVGLRPGFPAIATPEAAAAEIRSSFEAGASGVAFYNYGWTPLRNFEWIKDGLEAARHP